VNVDDRALQLLEIAGVFGGERIRGQAVPEAGKNLGASPARTYRLVEMGLLDHVKEEGRGSAVRIRWIDIAKYQAQNEHVTGEKPRLVAAGGGAT
jgi:hypothetical protein